EIRRGISCAGDPTSAVSNVVTQLEALGPLENGDMPLAIFIRNAADRVPGTQAGRKLAEILATLHGSREHLAALRRAYAAHLHSRYARVDLRGLVPSEHTNLLGMRVLLHDIYVPLTAVIVEHRLADYQTQEEFAAALARHEQAGEAYVGGREEERFVN